MKDPTSPETTSLAYDAMLPAWQKIQTVLDGTEAMRAAGTRYLPRHFGEINDSYKERLDRSTLKNVAKLTLNSWVGRPFSKPISFSDVPAQVEDLFSDVDLQGSDIQVFCRDWFYDGLAKAYSHCYVDFPRLSADGVVRTRYDDRVENVRPYWTHLQPEQVFFADSDMVGGREVLREIRIMEEVVLRDGFAEACQPQIRRVFVDDAGVVQVEIYRLKEPEKAKDRREWVVTDSYSQSLSVIPLVTFYSNRSAFMLGSPPLEDLVDQNIAHWQSTSDQRAVLTVARFPILAISGGTANEEIIVGPKRLLHSPDPAAKFYYVEHGGKAIEAGQRDIEALESSMAEYGAEFLKKRPGNTTATARALDSAEATSPLQDSAMRFSYALDQALELTAMWLKLPVDPRTGGGVSVLNTDFTDGGADQGTLTALRETRKMKDISRDAYLTELQTRGVLGDSFSIEEDAERLENEALSMNPVPIDLPPDDGEDEGQENGDAAE